MKYTINVPAREWKNSATGKVIRRRAAFTAEIEVMIDMRAIIDTLGQKAATAATRKAVIGRGKVRVRSLTKAPKSIKVEEGSR